MSASPRRLLILAEGTLDFHHGKTATSLLRYRPEEVVAVVDSEHAERTTDQVLGLAGETPIVARVEDAFALEPTALLIGIAPRGGALPENWRRQIVACIAHGMDVISGLHFMLNQDRHFVRAATQYGVTLTDVRTPPPDLTVAGMKPRRAGARVVTFVGSDCAVGKMTAALEVAAAARRLGLSTAFVATGQTGIMLEGAGVAVDRVIGDFMAGAVETLVVGACKEADWVFVEGQGSLLHPGYSGVTLALLHGSLPDAMILVHPPSLEYVEDYPLKIPSLQRLVQIYEEAAGWVKPASVVGVALNTRDLNRAETEQAITEAEGETGLSCTDPVKCGGEKLVQALLAMFEASAN
jgi:uncharacterized NAD-dependent epimerase/dehydratase family protein